MDKQDARQAEMDTRHHDSIAWRNSVREKDLEWRQTVRSEDKEWRQMVREEDKAWRSQLRNEDNDNRVRTERTTKRCCALAAAAQSSKAGTSPDAIFALAKTYEEWLDGKRD